MDKPITPETAPVGARLLLKARDLKHYDIFQAVIIEWAPSGNAVKVRYQTGEEKWSEQLPLWGVIVERLPETVTIKVRVDTAEAKRPNVRPGDHWLDNGGDEEC